MKKHHIVIKKAPAPDSFINICLCAFYFCFLTLYVCLLYDTITTPVWKTTPDTPWYLISRGRHSLYCLTLLISFSYLLFFGFKHKDEHPKRFRLILCAPIFFMIFLLFQQIIFYPNFK